MSHLTIETLARLVDEPASAAEAEHLETCEDCRIELEGLRADAAALAALPELHAPDHHWPGIEARLRAEGLTRIDGDDHTRVIAFPRNRMMHFVMRAAAALALFALGNASALVFLRGNADETNLSTDSRLVSQTTTPQTRDQAAAAVRAAETAYIDAFTQYLQMGNTTPSDDPLARLAALESIVQTTRAALGEAPADPVINGYHLTAIAQRDAIIRQLASSSDQTWF